jgi:hypothetical protein
VRLIKLIRFKIAWWKWFFDPGFRVGDPLLGEGEQRKINRRILWDRHHKKEPKREDFGLEGRRE